MTIGKIYDIILYVHARITSLIEEIFIVYNETLSLSFHENEMTLAAKEDNYGSEVSERTENQFA